MDTIISRNKPARSDIYIPEDVTEVTNREVWPMYETHDTSWCLCVTFADGSQEMTFYGRKVDALIAWGRIPVSDPSIGVNV